MTAARRIGILAGGGSLPREVADSVAARGLPLHIVAIASEADADFGPYPLTRVGWGEIGRMVATLREAHCTDLVIIGAVKRPDLATIRPDLGFFRALATVGRLVLAGGDDRVLRGVIAFFEGKGLRVVGPARVAPELMIGAGAVTQKKPDAKLTADARLGFDVVGALGPFDIGQGAIVTDGVVEAIEGAEGTDRLLQRVAQQRRDRGIAPGTSRGVLVKRAKPGQDERVDLPVIGPATITRAVEAGLAGVIVEAGRVLAATRGELTLRAEASGLVVAGMEIARGAEPAKRAKRPGIIARLLRRGSANQELDVKQIGKLAPPERTRRDIAKGHAVTQAMRQLGGSRAVVVVRGHVLAVETGEGVAAAIERAAGLRQWGDRRLKRRTGVVAMAGGRDCTAEAVTAVAGARFAGIVVGLERFKAGVAADAVAAADAAGLFIVGVGAGVGEDANA